MSWVLLRTDYTDATWEGLKKYTEVNNDDGTVSFQDVTVYAGKDKSFFGAKDANRMNTAMNILMSMVENGTDLYAVFQEYFETQQGLFSGSADAELEKFIAYLTSLKTDTTADIQAFTEQQEELFNMWFEAIRDKLSGDVAGKLTNDIEALQTGKQDKITGAAGQIVGFDASGKPVAQAPPDTGVTSFNGRAGAVTPQAGDYTAADVGAATLAQVGTAIQTAILDSWEGSY